jgi:hypothetical protein
MKLFSITGELTLSHERFSCMKRTTCSMSFNDPAVTVLLPSSTARVIPPSNLEVIMDIEEVMRRKKEGETDYYMYLYPTRSETRLYQTSELSWSPDERLHELHGTIARKGSTSRKSAIRAQGWAGIPGVSIVTCISDVSGFVRRTIEETPKS